MRNEIEISEIIAIIGSFASIIAFGFILRDEIANLLQNRVSWKSILRSSKVVIDQLETDHFYPDCIVAGGRGGAILASLVSWNLTNELIPIQYVDFHYVWDDSRRKIEMEAKNLSVKGKRVLICLGYSNTGTTALEIRKLVARRNPNEIRTAVLLGSCGRIFKADYKGRNLRKRKKFPWHFQNVTNYKRIDR